MIQKREKREPGIVADGAQRLEASEDHQKAVAEIEREVRAAFAEKERGAGPVRRFFLRLACRREIARRVRELTPPEALYLSSAS